VDYIFNLLQFHCYSSQSDRMQYLKHRCLQLRCGCLCVQGTVTTGDNKKTEELELRLKQERTTKEEFEQKYR